MVWILWICHVRKIWCSPDHHSVVTWQCRDEQVSEELWKGKGEISPTTSRCQDLGSTEPSAEIEKARTKNLLVLFSFHCERIYTVKEEGCWAEFSSVRGVSFHCWLFAHLLGFEFSLKLSCWNQVTEPSLSLQGLRGCCIDLLQTSSQKVEKTANLKRQITRKELLRPKWMNNRCSSNCERSLSFSSGWLEGATKTKKDWPSE